MTGVEYQARGDRFVSRLAAHLEMRSAADGSVVWEHAAGTAEDVCERRRRDYFVSYLVAACFFILITIPLARFTDHLVAQREARERAQAF